MLDKEDVLKCARWVIHYGERDAQYEMVTNRLTELGIPYIAKEGSYEGLVVTTAAGRFSGNKLIELLIRFG